MNKMIHLPFYARATVVVIGCYVLVTILSVTQDLILPLIYATIIAILVSPMVNFLTQRRVNRAVAIFLVSILAITLLAGLLALVVSQANHLSRSLPQFVAKIQELFQLAVTYVAEIIRIPPEDINTWISLAQNELIQKTGNQIGVTINTVSGAIASIFLTPVYIVMILFYQSHLQHFVRQLFGLKNGIEVNEVLSEIKNIIQGYLSGLFFQFLIVATLNSIGLLIIKLDYAILLAIIASAINVIPYLGAIAGVSMYMTVALVTEKPIYAIYVFLLYMIVQFIDNYFIVPKVVGSKVKLNALISLFAVIVGAGLWGIPGMLLSIPLVAVIKLIFDHIEPMRPWGFLLGDTLPPQAQAPRVVLTISENDTSA